MGGLSLPSGGPITPAESDCLRFAGVFLKLSTFLFLDLQLIMFFCIPPIFSYVAPPPT